MGRCKNCNVEIIGSTKRVYCSYKCRNIYVNKNIRDYTNNSKGITKPHLEKYEKNPKFCKHCGEKIPYEKKLNEFCNSSCSASYTNKYNIGIKHNMSKEGLVSIKESNKRISKERHYKCKIEYYFFNIKRCKHCGKILSYVKRTNTFCDRQCKNNFYINNGDKKKVYKSQCVFKFSLNDYPNEFDFLLIENHGWYKAKNHGDNVNGVSRDHMYSVMEGYRNNIDPNLISHPANCKLLRHSDNVSKSDKCSITINELKKRIIEWDNIYK